MTLNLFNSWPYFTNLSNGQTINVTENSTFVVDANAADMNWDSLTFSISGGADAGRFRIDPYTGVLSFVTAVDFEGAKSAIGNDQIYDVNIRVSDGWGGVCDISLFVNVLDVAEPDGVVNGTGGNDNMSLGYTDAQQDRITDGSDSIQAGDGADFVSGAGGNDSIDGGAGDDNLRGDGGNDVMFGGEGHDYMEGNSGNDSLFGGNGTDNMRGNDGDDLLVGGDGNEYMAGGAGNDSLHGELGNDDLRGEDGNDFVAGGEGQDYIAGGAGQDSLHGEGGNDQIDGGAGNDFMSGGNGDDVMNGDGGTSSTATNRDFQYFNNFDGADPLLGATQTLFGGAPGVTNVLNSPDDDNEKEFVFVQGFSSAQEASLAINPNLNSTERVVSFNTSFVLDMAAPNWAADHVDGFSINFGDMASLPANREYENGVGTGLAIRLDPLANVTEIRWNGTVIASAASFNLESRNVGTMQVSVTSAGLVSVTLAGDTSPFLVATIPSNQWATVNQSGWQFGFAGRTGDNAGFIYMDDVSITAQITGTNTTPTTGDDWMLGDAGNDLMLGNTGNDSLFGGAGNDSLHGELGNDSLEGGDGNDLLAGNQGNDTIVYGAGNDTVYGGDGDDIIDDIGGASTLTGSNLAYGDAGNDLMWDGAGNDTYFGGTGNDSLYGDNAGDDQYFGEAGDDALTGGNGNDRLDGGQGNDLMLGDAGNDSLFGGAGNDSLHGNDGSDSMEGGDGNDLLAGNQGNDTIVYGAGNDTVYGGDGDDIIDDAGGVSSLTGSNLAYGDAGNDLMWDGAGNDTYFGGTGNDSLYGDSSGDDQYFGEAGDDVLTGGNGQDRLDGGQGNDLMLGDAGNDSLFGGSGNDSLHGNDGNDVMEGGDGNDLLAGNQGNDTITYGAGNDTVYGGDGDDVIDDVTGASSLTGSNLAYGDAGNDLMSDGAGNDTYFGGTGNDSLVGDNAGDDQYFGDAGDDMLAGGIGNDALDGGLGQDTLYGDTGNDRLLGGDGDDAAFGGAGDDTLDGGNGNDMIVGDGGSTLVSSDLPGRARIVIDGQSGTYNGALLVEITSPTGQTQIQTLTGSYDTSIGVLYELNLVSGASIRVGITSPEGTFWSNSINAVLNQSNQEWARISFEDTANLGDRDFDDVRVDVTLSGNIRLQLPNGGSINPAPATLVPATGNDSIQAGAGNDTVLGGGGNDTVFGGQGDDNLSGEAGNDQLDGEAGNDRLFGGDGNDAVFGGAGDDTVSAGNSFGTDSALGGETGETAGDTLDLTAMTTATQLTFSASEAGLVLSAGATLAFAEFEQVNLGSGADNVTGNAAANTANAGAGNDTLDGGAGSDSLAGGSGDDLFRHNLAENAGANDRYDGGAGIDELHLSVTAAEWANPLFQADVAGLLAHIASANPAPFVLASTGLTVVSIERFTININGVPTDPVNALAIANADALATSEDGPAVGVNLLANDSVPDRAASVTLLTPSALGTVTIAADLLATTQTAVATFTPGAGAQALNAGQVVTEVLTYQVTDVDGSTSTATLTITLTGANDAASITGLAVGSISEDALSPVSGSLTVTDVDTGQAAFQMPTGLTGTYGTFGFNPATGAWSYTPNASTPALESLAVGAQVSDQITVTSLDGTASRTITVTITGQNDAPTLTAAVAAAVENGPSVSLNLATLGDDIDSDDTGASLTYTITGAPSVGTASISGTTLTYSGGAGLDSLAVGETLTTVVTITATDRNGASVSNDVTITITGTNDAPTLTAGVLAAAEDGPSVSLNLATLGDDIDSDDTGASLTYTITGAPSVGTASISGTTLTYSGGAGLDSLAVGETLTTVVTITATDRNGASVSNDVTITITGTNDAPTLTAGVLAAAEDGPSVSLNLATLGDDIDSDDTGASLTYTITGAPSVGTASISGTQLTYNAGTAFQELAQGESATQVIEVTATDRNGATVTSTVTVTISGTNDAPEIVLQPNTPTITDLGNGLFEVSGTLQFTDADFSNTHFLTAIDPLGQGVSITSISSAQNGAVGAVTWSYVIDLDDFVSGDEATITLFVNDQFGGADSVDVTFTVPGAGNTLPDVSTPITVFNIAGEGVTTINLLDFYSDNEGDPLEALGAPAQQYPGITFGGGNVFFLNCDDPAYQYLVDGQTQTFTYTYLVSDGTGSALATLEWTIQGTREGIIGGIGNEVLIGDDFESELLNGGEGDDTLTGGAGDDIFAYLAAGDGFDLITDFTQFEDRIGVSASAFGGNLQAGGAPTVLVGADYTAVDSGGTDGVFIYQTDGTDGTLYWDADGGLGDNAVAIAQLTNVANLTQDDFFLFI